MKVDVRVRDKALWAVIAHAAGITVREIDCIRYLMMGYTETRAALELGIAHQTIRHTLKRLRRKLGVDNNVSAAIIVVAWDCVILYEVRPYEAISSSND